MSSNPQKPSSPLDNQDPDLSQNNSQHDEMELSVHNSDDKHDEQHSDLDLAAVEPPAQVQPASVEALAALKKLDSKIPKDKSKDESQAVIDPFAHLPEHEAIILRKQIEVPPVKVGYFTLFRYARRTDIAVLILSLICAIIAGAGMPLMTVVFGGLAGQFSDYFQGKASYNEFTAKLSHMVLYFIYLAVGEFITTYIYVVGFIFVGERCTARMRERYLDAMLRQNMGFFDKIGAGEITTRITADTNSIQDGISEKLGLTLNSLATFVAAFVIAFIRSWKLTLILLSGVAAILISMALLGSIMVKWTVASQAAYGEAGTVAEEVLSSVRNASAFNTQEKLAIQYDKILIGAENVARKVQSAQGIMIALMFCIMNLIYSLAFWEGSRMLVDGDITLSKIITVNFAVVIGAFAMGNVAPNSRAFVSAVAAGSKILATIERKSPIDPDSNSGDKPEKFEGDIQLKNVKHIYPSRPEVVVMENVNLTIPAGKQTAIVGASGSGKSTIIGLVERFYDPVGGQVLLDNKDLQEINVHWLREKISLVQQEPVLFSTTIYENIRYGLLGNQFESLEKEKEYDLIIDAAKMANAHDFVSALPDGYETLVGERGFLLSGGQKQRIAIARAVVSDPRILLLDEATSALDTKSEGVVQAALDRVSEGRTTIIIAHRLSTIKKADKIVVMQNGRIVEEGKHDELLEQRGAYFKLVEAQRIAQQAQGSETASLMEESEEVADEKEHDEISPKLTKSKSGEYFEDPDDLNPKLARTHTAKSQSSLAMENRKPEDQKKYNLWTLIKLTWSFTRKEWPLSLVGFFFSAIAGAAQPTQSVFFAKSISALSLGPSQYGTLRSQINFYSLMYLMLAFVTLIANAAHAWSFGYCQEAIIHRARLLAFRTMLRQEIGWFDRSENTSGGLTSFLSTQIIDLAGLSGSTLGTILSVSTTLIGSFILAVAIGWKLALVCAAAIPVLIGCGYLRFSMLTNFARRTKAAYEGSASFACEATNAIRTVASLSRERDVLDRYYSQLVKQQKEGLSTILSSTLLYALSQSLVFLCSALGFWYGGTLIAKLELSMFQFFICFQAIIFGAQAAGTIFSFAPDMGKARHAAENLKDLFDRKPEIDAWSSDGEKIESVEGHIEFRDVHFRYPTRPHQPVLRGLNLTVKPGQYVALVGASGCGKSTTIGLLERFYDPLTGGVFVDGKEISKLHLNTYRNFLALVSQEPTLYQGTVKENIMLGADHDDVTEEEIVQACKEANIYDFVLSLPDGFNTICGSKGALLSGGQKQRIAIARALIRKPRILLLDEATSALDSESEKVVQAALDAAAQGRTTIAVAHRLSTIQKADIIYVIDNGRVVEQGNHPELLAKRGRYAELVTLQSLEKGAA